VTLEVDNGTTRISITSSKDLSNVVYRMVDDSEGNTRDTKIDDLSTREFLLDETSGVTDIAAITHIWVKSGNNASGDGPGYGECFVRQEETEETEETFVPACEGDGEERESPDESVQVETLVDEVLLTDMSPEIELPEGIPPVDDPLPVEPPMGEGPPLDVPPEIELPEGLPPVPPVDDPPPVEPPMGETPVGQVPPAVGKPDDVPRGHGRRG
jgi:hypothetical protein